MKKALIIFSFLGLFASGLMAQDYKVTTGVVNAQQGDFEEGLKNLNTALENPADIKAKNLPKAYYYKAKCLVGVLAKAARDKDLEKVAKYENAYLDAFEALKKAKETDDGKWGKKVEADMLGLYNPLLSSGLGFLNAGNDKSTPAEARSILLDKAEKNLVASTEINPDFYVAFDLLGQTHLSRKDTAAAMTAFGNAKKAFKDNRPKQPDLLIAYVYYRTSLLQRFKNNDLDASLKDLDEGKAVLESEWERVQANKANMQAEAFAQEQQRYMDAKKDLGSLELDVYLNSPEKLQEAIDKFEKAVAAEPDNYIIHVAYASLLEKVDMEKAVGVYEKAIEIDPENDHAYFNLGALYNNMAKVKFDAANDEKDYEKAEALQKEVDDIFKKALPAFEKALEINPNSLMTVRALKQITVRLNMMDDFKKYKDMEAEMTSGN